MADRLRLGVLISGGGRSLQNFIDLSETGRLRAQVVKVVSSRPDAGGLARARRCGIPACVVRRRDFATAQAFADAVTAELRAEDVHLVALAGFLSLYRIPACYAGRVMNVHPALLPSFGGRGFYGDRVHRAVLECGCKVSGCSVHFADNEYDQGPIIVQRAVPVLEDDDEHTLAARVFEQEKAAYPEAVNLFAEGRLRIEGRRVRVLPAGAQASP
ncbi:MAG: phosphoribosylglycinamide formyltransferase [Candidatus Brocadiaceae bacterium]|nr:phosphoribosylglycinamide formyltransferase [Candidatus Brocadiaceae bacterium]